MLLITLAIVTERTIAKLDNQNSWKTHFSESMSKIYGQGSYPRSTFLSAGFLI